MTDSQKFRIATDFLRTQKDVDITLLAETIGENRQKLYNIRRGSQEPSAKIIEDIIKEYPETKQFFSKEYINSPPTNENTVMDEHNLYYPFSTNAALSELVETQKKLIFKLETENALLGGRIAKLEAENAALRDVLTGRGKI